jgi:hypothetical protein
VEHQRAGDTHLRKPVQGQKHHWFPEALSKAWVGDDGKLARTNVRGRTRRFHPGGVGYGPDNHNILWEGGSPWDSTFEPDFDAADNAFPSTVRWLEAVASAHGPGVRSASVNIDEAHRANLAECLASLIVRSPRTRMMSEKSVRFFQTEVMGFPEAQNVHQTAGGNLQRLQTSFARDIRTGGKFAFLLAGEDSFLFGDGFMHNFNPTPDRTLNPMAMVAFTPTIAVLWFCPSSYPSFPKGVSLRLPSGEVGSFNDIVQIYAKDSLFHVGAAPKRHPAFEGGEHMIVHDQGAYHRAPVVDGWMREVLNVWEYG